MSNLEIYYKMLSEIYEVSTDDFSEYWLGKSRSYFRSMKSRNIDANTSVLLSLMERVKDTSNRIAMNENIVLQNAANKYELIAEKIGNEVASNVAALPPLSSWASEKISELLREKCAKSQNGHSRRLLVIDR